MCDCSISWSYSFKMTNQVIHNLMEVFCLGFKGMNYFLNEAFAQNLVFSDLHQDDSESQFK